MSSARRIYLDNGATSWPKPPAVYEAVENYLRQNGAAAGRGHYGPAQEVGRVIATARRRLASLLGVTDSSRVAFTFNGTDSLNAAIHGIVRSGDHVITTAAEHNSVLRPLSHLEKHHNVQVTRVPCDANGRVSPDDIRAAITKRTRLIAVVHASNVTGVLQPVREIASIARERDLLTLVDAAQSAGHVPIAMEKWNIDLLGLSGHKGMLGLLGTGVLAIGPRAAEQLVPSRQGGTGTHSERDEQPWELPERFESGNHNVVGLVGLERGTAYVEQRGWEALRRHELALTERLIAGLQIIPGLQLYGPTSTEDRMGLVSFLLNGFAPQELASLLDAEFGIQVRSGLHCAPRLHQQLGTASRGGTVRASVGPFTTEEEIDVFIEALGVVSSAG
jgi:cysteine desulfurase family protein